MASMDRILNPRPVLPASRQLFSDRALKAMIVPLLIEQLLQLVVGIADTMMVSYAGEATVSGVSLDTMIYTIFIYLFTAVATGAAVIVSQYIGRGDRDSANLAASQGFHIAAVLSLACTALTLVFGNAVLSRLYAHVDGAVMSACQIYLRIVALSFPANAIYNAGAALYRSMGKTRTTMFVSAGMNLLNVIGNAIGVFVLKAGAAGVAWPTTISWIFAAIVMTALCFNEKNDVFVRLGDMLRLKRDMAGRILRIAVPNTAEQVLFQLAKVVLGSLIATFGTSQIAANGIGQTLWSLAACMCTSMSPVFITVVGQCMGAGDTEAAAWYMRKLTRLSLLLSALWNALVLLLVPAKRPGAAAGARDIAAVRRDPGDPPYHLGHRHHPQHLRWPGAALRHAAVLRAARRRRRAIQPVVVAAVHRRVPHRAVLHTGSGAEYGHRGHRLGHGAGLVPEGPAGRAALPQREMEGQAGHLTGYPFTPIPAAATACPRRGECGRSR